MRWRAWDDATVIYDPISGDTHRIDKPSGAMLRALSEQGAMETARLRARVDPSGDEAHFLAVAGLLLDLDVLEQA
ncbi:HPr-rel-A system PqqD family peptide chaperone [Kineobactrum sediminis]|uniref:HPr-rel-A system PqqD family peptide chaperone n=1 Tax=Kineobactrum sediminis TaxID=1905677 RepID=UPI0024099DC6|nr:HPr-rel-A system PqqD family peptide chaperone [Kineobactrum sediminis]